MGKKLVFCIFVWKNVSVSCAFKNQIIDNCKYLCSRPWLLVLEKTEYLSNTYTHTTSEGPLRGRRGNVTKMVGLLAGQS